MIPYISTGVQRCSEKFPWYPDNVMFFWTEPTPIGPMLQLMSNPAWFAKHLPGTQFTVYINTVWAEDGPSHYGFPSLDHYAMFDLLMKTDKVGGKSALSIMTKVELKLLQNPELETLTKLLGAKTGPAVYDTLAKYLKPVEQKPKAPPPPPAPKAHPHATSAVSALVAMGTPATGAKAYVDAAAKADPEHKLDAGELLRAALKLRK